MNTFLFSNQYGQATLTPVSDAMPISMVSVRKMPALINEVALTTEQAEQLALITENQHIQIAFHMETRIYYVIYHVTADTVMVCRATIDYVGVDGISPAALIESLRTQSIAA